MKKVSVYDDAFYGTMYAKTWASAMAIATHAYDSLKPTSVLDLGCGVGTWLKAFQEIGVRRIQGVEGYWMDPSKLVLAPEHFRHGDLRAPIDLQERFDLVISLEVAEHLPDHVADVYLDTLVRHGSAILFSAAIPYQGGTDHVNERPQSYWRKKFETRGYTCLDAVRPIFWDIDDVLFWYRQNMFLYVTPARLQEVPKLSSYAMDPRSIMDIVHPELLRKKHEWAMTKASPPKGIWTKLMDTLLNRSS